MSITSKGNFKQQTIRRGGVFEHIVTAPNGEIVYHRATNQADRLRQYIHEGDVALKQWREYL
jgi:hypothetical protein